MVRTRFPPAVRSGELPYCAAGSSGSRRTPARRERAAVCGIARLGQVGAGTGRSGTGETGRLPVCADRDGDEVRPVGEQADL
jgi:hypothetical protein